jgi:pyrroline-5-carboxylate reductase
MIGGGRMGSALLQGLLDAGYAAPTELRVVEPLAARRDELAAEFPGVAVADAPIAAPENVVAVKPDHVAEACEALRAAGAGRVLSLAAGVTLTSLESWLGAGVPVVRSMPNTPALVGAGASAVACGSSAGDDDMEWAVTVLGAVGEVLTVDERALDAVTGLSGSGPAYVFLMLEAMIEGGVLNGLPRDVARRLATQTVMGAGRLAAETGEDPAALRAAVTSPGGTTAAGLAALEQASVRAAFMDAVSAATRRSRELAGG